MDGLLKDKVAVVTGAAQGIGLEIARLFTQHGARVLVVDLNAARVESAVSELSGEVACAVCDVTDEASVEAVADSALATFGAIDVWVNNAGITRDASLRSMHPEDFDAVINVHLKGTWLGVRTAAAAMRAQGSGSIVNMSSLSGKSGNPGQTNYSAAKAGIVGLTKASAKELAHRNIRVNAIQPGLIKTPMTAAMKPEVFAEREGAIPMKRAGDPAEVASVALFLASNLSSYMTGTVLEVGGGRLM